MKKIIFILLFLLSFPSCVFAASYVDLNKAKNFNDTFDPGDNLIYDISEIEMDDSNLTITGWGFPRGTHTISGKNSHISIIAIKTEDLNNYIHNPNSSSIKKIKKVAANYSDENNLYWSYCYKVSGGISGVKCAQTPLQATCTFTGTSDTSSCVHYNPKFKVQFNMSDLNNKFGGEEIAFIIQIEYEKKYAIGSSYCMVKDSNYNAFKNCATSSTQTIRRIIAFDHEKVNKSVRKLGVYSDSDFEGEFFNYQNFGSIRYYLDRFHTVAKNYIAINRAFKISDSIITNTPYVEYWRSENIRYYGLYFSNTKVGAYYPPGNGFVGYVPFTWGVIDGYVTFKFYYPHKLKNPRCVTVINDTTCDTENTKECFRYGMEKSIKTRALNLGGCTGKGTVKKIRAFDFIETFNLKFNIDAGISQTDVLNPGLFVSNFGYEFTRQIDGIKPSDKDTINNPVDYYYKASRYYKNAAGICIKESETWVSEQYLKSVLASKYDSKLYQLLNTPINTIDYNINSGIDDSFVRYKYPDSNSLYVDGSGECTGLYGRSLRQLGKCYIKQANSPGKNVILFGTPTITNLTDGKKAVYNLDIINSYVHRKSNRVSYRSSPPGEPEKYISSPSADKRYYVALNAKDGDELIFKTWVGNNSTVSTKIIDIIKDSPSNVKQISSVCKLKVTDGALEKVSYRVVDINNPFPNVVPTISGRASNWYEKWSSNNNYLLDRYNNTNKEYYSLTLNNNILNQIRAYNLPNNVLYYSSTDYYINGKSKKLRQWFTGTNFGSRNLNISKFGEGGKD